MKITNFFYFVDQFNHLKSNNIKTCLVKGRITNEYELFETLNKQLSFETFGWNWDALKDVLCGFENIREHKIIIFHEKIMLDDINMFKYIRCLLSAGLVWKKYPLEHKFSPLFLKNDKARITQIINSEIMLKWFCAYCNNLGLDY